MYGYIHMCTDIYVSLFKYTCLYMYMHKHTHMCMLYVVHIYLYISSVQLISHVWLFLTPRTVACKASLSITNSQSLLKLMSIDFVMPSDHLFLCCPLLPSIFPSIRVFSSESVFPSGGQSIGVSALTSVLPMNIQDWFHLGWLVWSPCSPRDSQEPSPTPQFKSINSSALSFLYSPTITSTHDYWKNHSFD